MCQRIESTESNPLTHAPSATEINFGMAAALVVGVPVLGWVRVAGEWGRESEKALKKPTY